MMSQDFVGEYPTNSGLAFVGPEHFAVKSLSGKYGEALGLHRATVDERAFLVQNEGL